MKRARILLLAMLLTVTWWGGSAAEEKQIEFQSGDYSYILLEDGTAEITYYGGGANSLNIPDTLGGYTVTSIGDRAFLECWSLSSVKIPESVTSIGDYAFFWCESLSSVSIPDSVTSIGESAFGCCDDLTNLTIPDSVTSIGNSAFSECESLSSVTIPDSVTSIGNGVFSGCWRLISVTIPYSVTSIGDGVFYECTSLTSVSISDGVTSIGDNAFYGCASLSSVTIPDSVTSIGDWAFDECDKLTLNVGRDSYAREYAIENDIPYIYPDTNGYEYVAPETFPSYTPASLNQRMATRSGPGTKYTEELGILPQDTNITLIETVTTYGTPWGLVEFYRKGLKYRAYTGMKRIDAYGPVAQGTLEYYETRLSRATVVYYGPGVDYARREAKVPAGTLLQVYGVENGFALCDYKSGSKWVRAYFPAI